MREKFVRVVRTFELPGTSKETEFIEKGGGREGVRERRRRRANERLVIEACPRRMKLNEEAPYSKVSVSLPQVQKQQEIQLSDRGRDHHTTP